MAGLGVPDRSQKCVHPIAAVVIVTFSQWEQPLPSRESLVTETCFYNTSRSTLQPLGVLAGPCFKGTVGWTELAGLLKQHYNLKMCQEWQRIGTSLVVQLLKLIPNAGGMDPIPGRGTKIHMLHSLIKRVMQDP